jgi:TRAP-type mannitol/chloroaromatic compound transport system permease small subunit
LAPLLVFSRTIDRMTGWIGRHAAWLILVAIIVSAGVAVLRHAFDLGSNAWSELQWYLFTAAFMLAAPYTLQRNEHIRIDIVTSQFSKRTRDWIDVAGHILMLLPFTAIMVWLCTVYFLKGVASGEMSGSANGLSLWPLRLIILVGFILLLLQGLSELIKRIAVLRGLIDDPYLAKAEPAAPIAQSET